MTGHRLTSEAFRIPEVKSRKSNAFQSLNRLAYKQRRTHQLGTVSQRRCLDIQ